ncbi:MAG: hypothetical protein JRD89_10595 [Deltaproteobacteria bacterium]|nr:hypothetical protein [Deltaproteobacteria bacterium]
MEEGATFTMEETIRYGVIQALLEKRMKNTEGALALSLSRQVGTGAADKEEGSATGS